MISWSEESMQTINLNNQLLRIIKKFKMVFKREKKTKETKRITITTISIKKTKTSLWTAMTKFPTGILITKAENLFSSS